MAVPARPISGNPIDSAWGQVAHDTAVAQDIQAGTVNAQSGNPGSAQGPAVAVVFARPFASPPAVVVAGSTSTAIYIANVTGITATGFTIVVRRSDGGAQTTAPVTWIAIGPRA